MRDPSEELAALASAQLRRSLRAVESPTGRCLRLDGRELLDFSSNDYLGLAHHPALVEAFARAAREHGVGSGASRLLSGSLGPHRALEEDLARFKSTEAALTFATGYATAVGTLSALCGKGDFLLLDKLSHACLIDGARLSGARLRVFPHNHLGKLESHLRWAREQAGPKSRILVVTESVFSMDGDRCPLPEIVDLKNRYGAWLLLDEAHALGVVGPGGRGLAAELQLAPEVELQMGTLGKALGTAGGYLAASRPIVDLLINRARSLIYSTAPPPAQAAVARAALQLLLSPEGTERQARLQKNLATFARQTGRPLPESAILPLVLGQESKALEAQASLLEAGFFVPAVRYPTVAKKQARLRLTLSAAHTTEDLLSLTQNLPPGLKAEP
ncbi:MAG: 8-amino-7-oxononanoate synthase [Verrucomicrobiota bacterium]